MQLLFTSARLHVACEWQPIALQYLFLLAAQMFPPTSTHPTMAIPQSCVGAQPILQHVPARQAVLGRSLPRKDACTSLPLPLPLPLPRSPHEDGSWARPDGSCLYVYTYSRVATAAAARKSRRRVVAGQLPTAHCPTPPPTCLFYFFGTKQF